MIYDITRTTSAVSLGRWAYMSTPELNYSGWRAIRDDGVTGALIGIAIFAICVLLVSLYEYLVW